MRLMIYADGASWGNPGPAAIGAVIKDEQQNRLASISQSIGHATNNQAEYKAVIAALRTAAKFKATEVIIHLDSELIVRQLAGRYRVKNAQLRPMYVEVVELMKKLSHPSVIHIRDQENTEAHALAQSALRKLSKE